MASWLIRLSLHCRRSGCSTDPAPDRPTAREIVPEAEGRDQGGCIPREGLVAGRGHHREFGCEREIFGLVQQDAGRKRDIAEARVALRRRRQPVSGSMVGNPLPALLRSTKGML